MIYEFLGNEKNQALLFFHAFTGCDTTSQFYGKGKKIAWESWKYYPEVTKAFLSTTIQLFFSLTNTSDNMKILEKIYM